jgi:ribosomal protein S8
MDYSFIQIFNEYRLAVIKKKTKFSIRYSRQNLLFVKFLLQKKLISGIYTQQQKNKYITLFLKYDSNMLSSIMDYSLSSKVAFKSPTLKSRVQNKQQNFTINIMTNQGKYSRFLARIR